MPSSVDMRSRPSARWRYAEACPLASFHWKPKLRVDLFRRVVLIFPTCSCVLRIKTLVTAARQSDSGHPNANACLHNAASLNVVAAVWPSRLDGSHPPGHIRISPTRTTWGMPAQARVQRAGGMVLSAVVTVDPYCCNGSATGAHVGWGAAMPDGRAACAEAADGPAGHSDGLGDHSGDRPLGGE